MYKIKLQPGDYARRDMGEDNSWYEKGELPPVGAEIIFNFGFADFRDDWQIARVSCDVFDKNSREIVIQGKNTYEVACSLDYIRPVKSEREKAIDEMLRFYGSSPKVRCGMMSRHEFCAALYDAGYRKTESQD